MWADKLLRLYNRHGFQSLISVLIKNKKFVDFFLLIKFIKIQFLIGMENYHSASKWSFNIYPTTLTFRELPINLYFLRFDKFRD